MKRKLLIYDKMNRSSYNCYLEPGLSYPFGCILHLSGAEAGQGAIWDGGQQPMSSSPLIMGLEEPPSPLQSGEVLLRLIQQCM